MNEDFMTVKEKDYVSYIFTKNLKQTKSDVNYKKLFNNIKQDYTPIKTEVKTSFIFGKDTCRDNKKNRYFTSVKILPDFLKTQCEIDKLISQVIYKKYYNTNLIINFDIENFLTYKSFWKLLNLTFEDSDCKKKWIKLIIKNIDQITDELEFKEFINTWYDKIPKFEINEIDNFFLDFFPTRNLGLICATCLLINNDELFNIFYKCFLDKIGIALKFDEVWNFLVVLMKYCNKDERFKLIKMTKGRLFEIRNDNEKIKSAKNFLKCLGLKLEDLI
ncbi:uncharacterized protein VNE69_01177 [Vairimorpha necatrix]|uniref:Uncharacterized protein n=1 Tax=Vairimorpha necatrix TaxID=6039 RepID=A0AAX4J8G0_9MICR